MSEKMLEAALSSNGTCDAFYSDSNRRKIVDMILASKDKCPVGIISEAPCLHKANVTAVTVTRECLKHCQRLAIEACPFLSSTHDRRSWLWHPPWHVPHYKLLRHGITAYRAPMQSRLLAMHISSEECKVTDCDLVQSKSWLFDVVANGRNGLDVDKFDYIQRDAFFTGVRIMSDFGRVLQYSKVCPAHMTSVPTPACHVSLTGFVKPLQC